MRSHPGQNGGAPLTRREIEVVSYAALGLNVRQIGAKLSIS